MIAHGGSVCGPGSPRRSTGRTGPLAPSSNRLGRDSQCGMLRLLLATSSLASPAFESRRGQPRPSLPRWYRSGTSAPVLRLAWSRQRSGLMGRRLYVGNLPYASGEEDLAWSRQRSGLMGGGCMSETFLMRRGKRPTRAVWEDRGGRVDQCPDRYGDRSSPGVRLRRNDGRGRRGQGDHGAQPDRVSGPPTDGQRGTSESSTPRAGPRLRRWSPRAPLVEPTHPPFLAHPRTALAAPTGTNRR